MLVLVHFFFFTFLMLKLNLLCERQFSLRPMLKSLKRNSYTSFFKYPFVHFYCSHICTNPAISMLCAGQEDVVAGSWTQRIWSRTTKREVPRPRNSAGAGNSWSLSPPALQAPKFWSQRAELLTHQRKPTTAVAQTSLDQRWQACTQGGDILTTSRWLTIISDQRLSTPSWAWWTSCPPSGWRRLTKAAATSKFDSKRQKWEIGVKPCYGIGLTPPIPCASQQIREGNSRFAVACYGFCEFGFFFSGVWIVGSPMNTVWFALQGNSFLAQLAAFWRVNKLSAVGTITTATSTLCGLCGFVVVSLRTMWIV